MPWARSRVGCWRRAAPACQTVTPRARVVRPQPRCCMAGCPAAWEWGHGCAVCLEQNQGPLSGSSAQVLFVGRERDSGALTVASHLSWTVLSLSKLICHFPLNTRGGPGSRRGPQGDTERPRRAGALLPEEEFNFLKATGVVRC